MTKTAHAKTVKKNVTARLFIEITKGDKTSLYHLIQLDPEPTVAKVAWQLVKDDGECHEVAVTAAGHLSCTCGDFMWRNRYSCKHIKACFDSGLFRKPKHDRESNATG